MKKRWRRAPRQVLRSEMQRRTGSDVWLKAADLLMKNLTKAVNAMAKGCVSFSKAFCQALLNEGGD